MKVIFVHNIIWSKYRLNLFNKISEKRLANIDFFVLQVARIEKSRLLINECREFEINHNYSLIYQGSYEELGAFRRSFLVICRLINFRYDLAVVTGYASAESWAILILSKLLRKRVILAVDSSEFEFDRKSKKNFFKRFFIRKVDCILGYGTSTGRLIKSLGGRDNVFVPFHCLSNDFYLDKSYIVNAKRDLLRGHFTFLYVGRLAEEKNILKLIASFNYCFLDFNDVRLNIVGDGPLSHECAMAVKHLSATNIFIKGPLFGDALTSAYMMSDCFILPSIVEPWGLVVNEALCLGTPVIVSDRCGCVRDLVDGNQDAIKFDATSQQDLERALLEAYSRFRGFDESRVQRCVELGQSYSPERAADTFFEAIESLKK